jgi:hypothetical protein
MVLGGTVPVITTETESPRISSGSGFTEYEFLVRLGPLHAATKIDVVKLMGRTFLKKSFIVFYFCEAILVNRDKK